MNRSVIITLALIISLICAYYLSFTYRARVIQADIKAKSTNKQGVLDTKKRQKMIDSLWNKPVSSFLGIEYTYKQIKDYELALGLDLQGGMHATLEVSPVEILRALAGNTTDAKFNEAIKQAEVAQKTSNDNFVNLFATAYEKISPNGSLANLFTNSSNKGKIDLKSSNSQVISVIKEEVSGAIDRSFDIIRTRIDKFGVTNPTIQKIPGTGRILVELPGVENPERVRKLLSGTAKLEFYEVYEGNELLASLEQLNSYLVKENAKNSTKKDAKEEIKKDTKDDLIGESGKKDTIKKSEDDLVAKKDTPKKEGDNLVAKKDTGKKDTTKDKTAKNDKKDAKKDSLSQASPIMQLLMPNYDGFAVKLTDTARVNELLSRDVVKNMFPSNLKLLWAVKADAKANTISLFTIKKGRGGKAPLDGSVITNAYKDFDQKQIAVSMQMNTTGARIWKRMTEQNLNKRIAIVLDNYVYSAPMVNGVIPNGSSQISGNFTIEEGNDLANVLKAGKLPAPTRIVEEATLGASLGGESITQGLNSMLLGLSLVVLFMILYYKTSGVIANLALLFNIFFIIGLLAGFHAVLTLAGLAGIVLTIGMSVDANVLIFERVKEELRNGKTLKEATDLGYEKAYSSIIDANITTFLIGVMLYAFGTGGIKGFALTLMIGIVSSVFTAVFITRAIIEFFEKRGNNISFNSFILNNAFVGSKLNFVNLRVKAYIFSGALIVIGAILWVVQGGFNLGVDFKGGRSYVVEFEKVVSLNETRAELVKNLGSVEVKTYNGDSKFKITTSYLTEDESDAGDKKVESQVLSSLKKFENAKPKIVSFSKVGATIADDIYKSSLWTIFWSLVSIFFYILLRFKRWQYSLAAVLALLHDVLIVFAGMTIARALGFSYEVDQVFIAAMLTVIGYSINDTVVVFDRIREFAGDTRESNFGAKLNSAINDTLSRTIMTSGTTLIVVAVLFFFGGQVLSGFSYALLVGIIIGTYSSIFIASPVVLDISTYLQRKKAIQLAAE
ncbi:MAG: protein translocase subunit SecDF [Bacteroidetes bacterium]|nr:MAG: protein translocase subunit SecDF [Bacteroidota bacterium]